MFRKKSFLVSILLIAVLSLFCGIFTTQNKISSVNALENVDHWYWEQGSLTDQKSSTLPNATVGEEYSVVITSPYDDLTCYLFPVLTLSYVGNDPQFVCNGVNVPLDNKITICGKPTYAGTYTVRISDTANELSKDYTLTVDPVKYSVGFDKNTEDEITGTIPATAQYEKDDEIILPTITRVGYNLTGWNDGTTTYNAGATYTVGTSAVTLTAVWTEKTTITITETTQSYTYNQSPKSFVITGATGNLNDFTIKYYNTSDVEVVSPTNTGTYKVVVTRLEDSTYKAFSTTIVGGLVINKAVQSVSITNDISKTYDGNAVSAPTYTFSGDGVVTIEYKKYSQSDSAYTTTAPINANEFGSEYTVRISVTEGTNYLAGSTTKNFTISQKSVAVTFCADNFKYNGEDQKSSLIAKYENINGVEVCLDIYSMKIQGIPDFANPYRTTFLEPGTYDIDFRFETEEEANNYAIIGGYVTNAYIKSFTMVPTYTVVYNGNGATSGTLPASDGVRYDAGDEFTLEGYYGGLKNTGKTFVGWNTSSSATTALSSYSIDANNANASLEITLYAVWIDSVHVCDEVTYDVLFSNAILSYDSGNYYLNSNLTLNSNVYINGSATVKICLNGYVLNMGENRIVNNGILYVCDCQNNDAHTHYFIPNSDGIWEYDNTETESEYKCTGGVITNGNIAIESSGDLLNITGVNFVGNCGSDGGAINTISYTNIYNSTFLGNKAYVWGGAIFAAEKILIENCTFMKNIAAIGGAVAVKHSVATIIDTTITDNSASSNGGGFYLRYDEATCFTEGTLITMGDGSTKKIEEIVVGDVVKSFNHETGEFENNAVYFTFKGENKANYFTLNFESGTTLSICGMHDLLEKSAKKYVTITEDNYNKFIGKYFYNANTTSWDKLLSVTESVDEKEYYSIYVGKTFNSIANGMLSIADDVDFFLNIYEFNDDATVNFNALQVDIEKYGLLDFEDCVFIQNYEDFVKFNAKYYYIWMSKGYLTEKDISGWFQEYEINSLPLKSSDSSVNTYATYSGGITGPYLILVKNVTIRNNKVGENENNIYLTNDSFIKIIEDLNTEDLNLDVGVNLEGVTGTFIKDDTQSGYVKYLTSDNSDYSVFVKDGSEENTFNYNIERKYTVVYNTNTGSGTAPVDNTAYGLNDEATLKTVGEMTKTDYAFVGWKLDPEDDEEEIKTGTYTISGEDAVDYIITFYAIWKEQVILDESEQTYTYNGEPIGFDLRGACKDITNFVIEYYVNNAWTTTVPTNAGIYDVRITRAEDETYAPYSKTTTLTISKLKVDKPTVIGFYMYNGLEKTVSITGVESYMTTTDSLIATNAGTHTVTYQLTDDNYEWLTDGVVTWTINKAQVEINVPITQIVKTYGQTIILPTVTSNFGTVICNKTPEELKNAGTHTVTFSVEGTENFYGNSASIIVIVNKKQIEIEWTNKEFVYDGNAHVPTATAVGLEYEDNVEFSVSGKQTKVGRYFALASFKNEEQNYLLPSNRSTQFIIKAEKLDYTQNEGTIPTVSIETEKGFDADVVLEVAIKVVKSEIVDGKQLSNNYNMILSKNEILNAVYDVKLYKNGVEIQPSELEGVSEITVKMLIPAELVGKEFKIIHVHNQTDFEEIVLGEEAGIGTYIIDNNGYLITKINKLSEFAFITEKAENCFIHWILIALLVLFIIFVILCIVVFKRKINLIVKLVLCAVYGGAVITLACFGRCTICITFIVLDLVALIAGIVLILTLEKGKKFKEQAVAYVPEQKPIEEKNKPQKKANAKQKTSNNSKENAKKAVKKPETKNASRQKTTQKVSK